MPASTDRAVGRVEPQSAGESVYADVIVPRHLHRAFTYSVPSALRDRVRVGSVVLVPFGAGRLRGLIISLTAAPPPAWLASGRSTGHLREIISVGDGPPDGTLDPGLLELTRLVSERYLAPWGQCLRLVEPARSRRPVRLALTEAGRAELGRKLPQATREVLARLATAPRGLTANHVRRALRRSGPEDGDIGRLLTALTRRGWIREEEGRRRSAGTGRRRPPHREASPLTIPWPASESRLPPQVHEALGTARHAAFLLEASGAVRQAAGLAAVQTTVAAGRQALLIAPEITAASTLAAQMMAVWQDRVALVHSGLPALDRTAVWDRIRSGTVDVVVGTRLAVFAPLARIGLIAVDGEDDPALKEQEEPRYHAREVAWMRARQHGAVLLLGSAHPSLEVRTSALVERVAMAGEPAARPEVQVVNLCELPPGALLSAVLLKEIERALEERTGVVVFQNRKGFASSLVCRDCGTAPQCPRCSLALTFYKTARRLGCRYCGHSAGVPELCPACRGRTLSPVGWGTERIEELLRGLFPLARIGRLDRDTAPTARRADALRRDAARGAFDMLVGTQMLVQGPPLPPAGLVAVPYADAGFHLPDFRSAERAYQILTDAVALARPASAGGRVVVQTHAPEHHAIAAIRCGNPEIFYDREKELRKALGYPPFTSLISLGVSAGDPQRAKAAAQEWARLLSRQLGSGALPALDGDAVLGPIPSAVAKIRGRHRWQLLVKARDGEAARDAVRTSVTELERRRRSRDLKFDVDVDPVDML